jgi:hypothetical protein
MLNQGGADAALSMSGKPREGMNSSGLRADEYP